MSNFASTTANTDLILASGSAYRAELLQRLRLPFRAIASAVDETPLPGETVPELVRRLAAVKAGALMAAHPHSWVLGSDQSAAVDGQVLGKPGSLAAAQAQLRLCSGRRVEFHTAVALRRGRQQFATRDLTTVQFRVLSDSEIARYLAAEPALDCAGSFKCEGYGISLFEAIETCDPTALIGLPLIATCRLLRAAGFVLP